MNELITYPPSSLWELKESIYSYSTRGRGTKTLSRLSHALSRKNGIIIKTIEDEMEINNIKCLEMLDLSIVWK